MRPQADAEHGREQGGGDEAEAGAQRPGRPRAARGAADRRGEPGQQPAPAASGRPSPAVAGGAFRARGVPGAARAGVEVAAGAPAEHRLGEQRARCVLHLAELPGGVAAVAAVVQMPLDVRQQGAAAADRHVEQPVVEAAVVGRREVAVGAHAALAELVPGLLQGAGGGVGVHAQQPGRDAERFGLDLGVPQQAPGGRDEALEGPLGEPAVLRDQGRGGPHAPASGGFVQLGQGGGHAVLGGPQPDRVPHGQQQPGAQRGARLAQGQPVEDLVEGGRGHHGREGRRGGEADHRVVVDRLPVAGDQQGDAVADFVVRAAGEPGGEGFVGLPGDPAGRRAGRTGGVGGGHEEASFGTYLCGAGPRVWHTAGGRIGSTPQLSLQDRPLPTRGPLSLAQLIDTQQDIPTTRASLTEIQEAGRHRALRAYTTERCAPTRSRRCRAPRVKHAHTSAPRARSPRNRPGSALISASPGPGAGRRPSCARRPPTVFLPPHGRRPLGRTASGVRSPRSAGGRRRRRRRPCRTSGRG